MAKTHRDMQIMDEALFTAPVNDPNRNKLRDVVKGDAASLARRARKFLTLGAVYAERERLEKERADDAKTTPYRKWLRSVGITGKDQATLLAKTAGMYQSAPDDWRVPNNIKPR
jgi:hypothetical protein